VSVSLPPAEKALAVDPLLADHYGAPFVPFSYRDPLSELVKALLSHRTRNAVSRAAFNNLEETFGDWSGVMNADTGAVEQAIKAVTFPEVKAPRIQAALRNVVERTGGDLSLDELHYLSVPEARQWLEEIPGVGAKTSAAVLSFSRLRKPALVVDMHHLRVAQRLGLVPPKCTLDKGAYLLQSYLPGVWDGQRVYDSHQGFMRHGQKVCTYKSPACTRCIVSEYCDYAHRSSGVNAGGPGTQSKDMQSENSGPDARSIR